ncbi:hypothetical protein BJ875DRAFT_2952, partial [Amylocarpus encephaloides]
GRSELSCCSSFFPHRLRELSHRRCKPSRQGANRDQQGAKTFHQFNSLPIELRRNIWDQAASVGRIVEIKVKIEYSKYSHHSRGLRFSSKTPVPALLHVNAEAREIGLNYWQLSMKSHYFEARIYINFKKDIVYFGDVNLTTFEWSLATLIRDVPESELAKINHLAVTQELWNYRSECNIHILPDFGNLKRITLVKERRALDKSKPLVFVAPKDFDSYVSEIPGTDFGQLLWPDEYHEIIDMFIEDAYEEQVGRMPIIDFRVLAQAPPTWKLHLDRLNGKLGLFSTK